MSFKMTTRRVASFACLLSLTACSGNPATEFQPLNPLFDMSEPVVVASGFISTEGPVWHADSDSLIFSDIPGDTIYSLNVETGELFHLRKPSNNSNGLALDAEGYLLAAEQKTRTITRMHIASGEVLPFVSSIAFSGQQSAFNSPNDMAIHNNGGVYFTDPPFGLRGREGERELNFNGVFVRKTSGTIELLKALSVDENPNGIIFNPDQSILYLAVSHDVSGPILAFDVDAEGNLSNEREFARAANTDGMAVDVDGNLYVATRTGVRVWTPDGREWGMITLPGGLRTTNVAFGGAEMNTLYITGRSHDLYAVTLNARGAP